MSLDVRQNAHMPTTPFEVVELPRRRPAPPHPLVALALTGAAAALIAAATVAARSL